MLLSKYIRSRWAVVHPLMKKLLDYEAR